MEKGTSIWIQNRQRLLTTEIHLTSFLLHIWHKNDGLSTSECFAQYPLLFAQCHFQLGTFNFQLLDETL